MNCSEYSENVCDRSAKLRGWCLLLMVILLGIAALCGQRVDGSQDVVPQIYSDVMKE